MTASPGLQARQGTSFGLRTLALATFVGALHLVASLVGLALYRLFKYGLQDWPALVIVAVLCVLGTIPLEWTTGNTSRKFIKWVCNVAAEYFPVKVIVEEPLKAGQPYVMGLEPHSALPLGIPIAFATDSPILPVPLRGMTHGMATSVCFFTPIIRQLWWALGLRPVSKQLLDQLISQGRSVVVCPGGVRECLYMDHSSETLFLNKRTGFVRLAMKHGAPLVPVFVFGQSLTYSWWRPGPAPFIHWLSRQIGVVPMLIWGRWGTPIPHQTPMCVVIGRPIQVPHMQSPSHEEVATHLKRFVDEMRSLVERHKAACGTPDLNVRIM